MAAFASIGLFGTLFLPWYQETVVARGTRKLETASTSLTGWGAFSFVEAAVLLVAIGVLTLLFQRAEGRAFHLPGGDGWVITAAGFWTCVLVIWRIFDKQGTSSQNQVASSSGIEWGILVALAVAAFLAYSGSRIRAAHQPEPPLPGERLPVRPSAPYQGEEPRYADSAAPGGSGVSGSSAASGGSGAAADPDALPKPVPAPTAATRRLRRLARDEHLTLPLDDEDSRR